MTARTHLLMLAVVLSAALASMMVVDRIPANDGLGWDGKRLGEIAADFHGAVFVRGVDPYVAQRVLPSAVVHYGLRLLGLPRDARHIRDAFEVYNLVLLLTAWALWWLIADALRLGIPGRWIGFTGLFVNFAILKFAFYYPVLTDVTAFTAGLAMMYCYLRGRTVALLAVTLLGSFAWPVTGYIGAVLLLLPAGAVDPPAERDARLATLAAAALTALLLTAFVFLYHVRRPASVGFGPVIPVVRSLVYLSVALCAVYAYAATRTLLGGIDREYLWRVVRSIRAARVACAVLALAVPWTVVYALPGGASPPLVRPRDFAEVVVLLAVARPLGFFISDVVYFGPVLLLAAGLWPAVSRLARELGPGLVLALFLAVLISLTPESRQNILALPLVLPLVAAVGERCRWPTSVYWFLGATALAFSRVWLRITTAALPGEALTPAEHAQYYYRYFISQGPYMPHDAFVVHTVAVAVVGVAIYWLVRPTARARDHARASGEVRHA